MADSQALLESLDQLRSELDQALADQNWEQLAELNARVKPAIEPLLDELEAGRIEPALIRARLEALNEFVESANRAAVKARDEARESLKGVNENRNAARAYENVSTTPRR
ncbi:SOS cell division inhibitor [Marinobacter sp.]|uniref:SOS cell division inhibitor n=1 Tax=Marinobacter sp. TaxID=50741 RepID=UPI001A04A2FF|nr:SOS cell division inhibitor [Marinobacter sp.]MBE0485323.1 SOS cell division inhibitor [Marinobacter sp.]